MKSNILKNKITVQAILFTFMILLVYRIGSFVVTPGIDPDLVNQGFNNTTDLAGFFNMFGGGSIATLSLFALGVAPYISASIIIQLLENDLIPSFAQWKSQGIEGQNKRTKYTKYLALTLSMVQAIAIPLSISLTGEIYLNPGIYNYITIAIMMTAGTACMMWLSDRITEKGVGNGTSVIITAGILSTFPQSIINIIDTISKNGGDEQALLLIAASIQGLVLILLIIAVIYFTLAYRKVAINYVRTGRSTVRKNSYIPIKLNPAGVIPVIFASPLFLLLDLLNGWIIKSDFNNYFTNDGGSGVLQIIYDNMFNLNVTSASVTIGESVYWWIIIIPFTMYFAIIVLFSMFYSYVQMNPENISESLEKQSAYVIGIRPGIDTEEHITDVIFKTSLWGGLALATIAIVPFILQQLTPAIGLSILGTGLIIVVNVIVQVYTALEMRAETKKYRKILGE